MSSQPQVILKSGEDRRVRRGHLWVFSNEIAEAPTEGLPGQLVEFLTSHRAFLGVGFYHPKSLIAGRLLDRTAAAVNAEFFVGRLRRAQELRERLFSDTSWRWVNGESDDLPGLVIDRYDQALVVESTCAGMDLLLPQIVEALGQLLPQASIVLRNDATVRKLEGLSTEVRVLRGAPETPHWFVCEGLRWAADLLAGQKTGFFFDQRINRRRVAELSSGRRLLDVFSHTGGFALTAARAGATHVTAVDESASALERATLTAQNNDLLNRFTAVRAEAFEYLTQVKETYDLVVLDPPRFASSKKNLPSAIKAYIRLNTLGLKRVSGGGFLATASCSQLLDRETFRQILSRAAHESGRRVRLVHWGTPSMDHPVRPGMPETDYLKFAILAVG